MMLIVMAAATFMDGLDGSIVSIALPEIAEDLGVDTATSSWATIIYLLTLSALIVPFARISAQVGVRSVLAIGLSVFTAGSVLCGLSGSFHLLIAFRIVQSVGAAMMAAACPMCCTEHLPVHRLGFGLSVVTIGASLGFAFGPVVGGAITDFLDWQWIFFINVPFGAVATALILKAIPPSGEGKTRPHLDVPGTVVLCVAVVSGVLGVETLSYNGMLPFSTACILLCLVLLCVFVRMERRAPIPLLKTAMFRDRGFSSVFLCLMLVNMAYMGMLYLIPFYGQVALGMSLLKVGTFLLISAVVTAVVGMPLAKWSDHTGRRWFCVAAGLTILATFLLYGLFGGGMTDPEFLLVAFLQGIGWGFVGGPMASRLVEHAADERDMASSLMNEAYYIGGALGTAVAAMLFTLLSGAEGVDISLLAPGMFLDGFVPTAFFCGALGAVIAVLSFILKDDVKTS